MPIIRSLNRISAASVLDLLQLSKHFPGSQCLWQNVGIRLECRIPDVVLIRYVEQSELVCNIQIPESPSDHSNSLSLLLLQILYTDWKIWDLMWSLLGPFLIAPNPICSSRALTHLVLGSKRMPNVHIFAVDCLNLLVRPGYRHTWKFCARALCRQCVSNNFCWMRTFDHPLACRTWCLHDWRRTTRAA